VRLLQLQFGRVLAGHDALVVVDIAGQTIEQRRLAGADAARNKLIHPAAAGHLEDLGAFRRDRSAADQLLERRLVLTEFADGERRPVDRERRHDGVDARTVRQARVADRRGFLHAAADLADDTLTDVEKLLIIAKPDAGLLNFAAHFDIDRAGAVHHDNDDLIARQQWLERTIAENVVANIVEQILLLGDRHHNVLDRDDLIDDVADFLARGIGIKLGELAKIDGLDQSAENRALRFIVSVGTPQVDRGRDLLRRAGRPAVLLPAVGAPRIGAPSPADGNGARPPCGGGAGGAGG
jgi:hypothetical protein